MKVSFYSIGCKVNTAELSQLKTQFSLLGHEIVNFSERSDIVLINTCTVTNRADADSRKIIRRAQRTSPDAFIAVVGCYSQLKPEEVAEIEGVDAIFGTKEKFNVPELIKSFEKKSKPEIFVSDLSELSFDPASTIDDNMRTRVTFKIQDGCDYNCSYCTIPGARGKSRSMNFKDALNKFREFEEAGIKEIVLSGVNLGEYKAPSGETFTDLIKAIDKMNPDLRIRISSIEPNLLNTELLEIAAGSDTVCPHFHIPLQSGSPEILRLMKRRYKAETFIELIHNIKELIPHCGIGVDVITGFPGETDELFNETFDLLDSLQVTYLHVFSYSERDNTPAAKYINQVPHKIRKERTNILRKLSDKKLTEFYYSQIGSTRKVIPETQKNDSDIWLGWTENYIRTEFTMKTGKSNSLLEVKLVNKNKNLVQAYII